MAGESYLSVVTSSAVSLNPEQTLAANPGCSPVPCFPTDVVAEGRGMGASEKACAYSSLSLFFFLLFQISEIQVQRKGNYFLQQTFI